MGRQVRVEAKDKGERLKVQIALAQDRASQDHIQSHSQNQYYLLVASLQDLDQAAVGAKAVVGKIHL